jgi:hypothetical protein
METFSKKEFIEEGFEVEELIPGVLLVKNFITEKELSELLDIINNTTEEDWRIEYTTNLKRFCLEKFGREDVENLVKEGKFEITQGWEDKNLSLKDYKVTALINTRLENILYKAKPDSELASMKTLQRMQQGVQLKSHTDQSTDPAIYYAQILYLNDDYKGGELFFVNKNFKVKPKPRSLLVFPGTEEFEHGVNFVEDGPIRYVMVSFLREKGFYEKNKY